MKNFFIVLGGCLLAVIFLFFYFAIAGFFCFLSWVPRVIAFVGLKKEKSRALKKLLSIKDDAENIFNQNIGPGLEMEMRLGQQIQDLESVVEKMEIPAWRHGLIGLSKKLELSFPS